MSSEPGAIQCEVLRTDSSIFDVWARFTVAGESLRNYQPVLPADVSECLALECEHGLRLIMRAHDLISDITRARVSMPKSSEEFRQHCDAFLAIRHRNQERMAEISTAL